MRASHNRRGFSSQSKSSAMQKVGKISSQPHTFVVHVAIHGAPYIIVSLSFNKLIYFSLMKNDRNIGEFMVNGIPFGLLCTLKKVRKRFDPCK